jgi:hypothetical protein
LNTDKDGLIVVDDCHKEEGERKKEEGKILGQINSGTLRIERKWQLKWRKRLFELGLS